MTVLFRLPWRSIWAAPRKPTSMRPAWSQYAKISGTDTTASAVSASSPSPIATGRRAGSAPPPAGAGAAAHPPGAERGREPRGLRADRAALVDEDEPRGMGPARE